VFFLLRGLLLARGRTPPRSPPTRLLAATVLPLPLQLFDLLLLLRL
jgi:hypothetical protein